MSFSPTSPKPPPNLSPRAHRIPESHIVGSKPNGVRPEIACEHGFSGRATRSAVSAESSLTSANRLPPGASRHPRLGGVPGSGACAAPRNSSSTPVQSGGGNLWRPSSLIGESIQVLISVCVPTVRGATLPFTIAAIRAQSFEDWELLVVGQGDGAARAELSAAAASEDPRVRYIHISDRGLSRARNTGIAAARAGFIAFTDDDCEPDPDWLEKLHESFVAEPSVGILAGDLLPSSQSRWRRPSACPATRTMEYLYDPAGSDLGAPPGFYWAGANFAVRRSVFDLVGGFDEFLGAGSAFPSAEDTDFGLRAEMHGVMMWTRPSIVVRHTYGRRYGLRAVLRHHRGYALGSGALGGKLRLLDHRLSRRWGQPVSARDTLRAFIKHPPRTLLDIYRRHYDAIGTRRYLAQFELDDRALSRPKADSATVRLRQKGTATE
jgi:glycosyltransferase involved in cell wall biosynthesis